MRVGLASFKVIVECIQHGDRGFESLLSGGLVDVMDDSRNLYRLARGVALFDEVREILFLDLAGLRQCCRCIPRRTQCGVCVRDVIFEVFRRLHSQQGTAGGDHYEKYRGQEDRQST